MVMEDRAEVCILLAAFNGEEYLGQQIDSIIGQTYQDWKLFIRDDGSTDRTRNIIGQYCLMEPERISFVNQGSSTGNLKKNIDLLLKQAAGYKFYMLADQDDVWLPEKIFKMITVMEKLEKVYSEPLLLYSDLMVVNKNLEVISTSFTDYSKLRLNHKNTLQQLLLYNVIPGCSMMFNNKLKKLIYDIPEESIIHDWWISMAAAAFGKIVCVKESLMFYRQHNNNAIGAVRLDLNDKLKRVKAFKKLREYSLNNKRMKKERFRQTSKFYSIYNDKLSEKNRNIIKKYLQMLYKNKRIINIFTAYTNHFEFYGKLYTLKFWGL